MLPRRQTVCLAIDCLPEGALFNAFSMLAPPHCVASVLPSLLAGGSEGVRTPFFVPHARGYAHSAAAAAPRFAAAYFVTACVLSNTSNCVQCTLAN
ncbi:hypothetical protein EON67_03155, partial [archaeon]